MELSTLDQANNIRQRLLAGEEVSREELSAAISFLRTSRAAAPTAKAPKVAKDAKEKPTLMSILSALKGPEVSK